MPERQYVRLERDQEIAIVTIDRRRKLNALNPRVVTEIGSGCGTSERMALSTDVSAEPPLLAAMPSPEASTSTSS